MSKTWFVTGSSLTDRGPASSVDADRMPEYAAFHERLGAGLAFGSDPAGVVRTTLDIADVDRPPLRVLVGSMAFEIVTGINQQRLAAWGEWESTSRAADS